MEEIEHPGVEESADRNQEIQAALETARREDDHEAGEQLVTPLPWDAEDEALANGDFAQATRSAARVTEIEPAQLRWVPLAELKLGWLRWIPLGEQTPTETGTYVVMDRMRSTPRLLKLEGVVDRHWRVVTHWYGPLPVCGG
jgi:hypothetical protein